MASFCNIVLMGNITRELEQRTTPGGMKVLDINIAVNTYSKGAENNQITTFYRGTMWGDRTDVVANNFKKGDPILLSGRDLTMREWEANGKSGTSLEFRVDDFSFVGAKGQGGASESSQPSSSKKDDAPVADVDDAPIDLSDIPF
jgi:single-strand DNA-binding protein